eukprot:CAMPEP_0119419094 /NCGR_PEP_ID=MMETSP1335-20130426/19962_1 /TAXON_ID=259385 /ORGANISM="Chrysoculter rhomboideus, Strain RCC1486" /LENGTH=93 /DNA_ID=CAMNT_0007444381 /DNA_START=66 /DNA_END=347 /DNA_ORIENTATION=+
MTPGSSIHSATRRDDVLRAYRGALLRSPAQRAPSDALARARAAGDGQGIHTSLAGWPSCGKARPSQEHHQLPLGAALLRTASPGLPPSAVTSD